MKRIIPILITAFFITGCSGISPVIPDVNTDYQSLADSVQQEGPYRLWGEWTFHFNETHDRVDVVPMRNARMHLNALKFLESYCTDCLKITGVHNNGDGTIDLGVNITHPFKGFPEYTGFDVKGIIMFDGSWTNPGYKYYPPWPDPMRVSWRHLGDPQVMNADGYVVRWNPSYDSGLQGDIFNYWEGKHASGTPCANINAYKNFYNVESRHIFTVNASITQTYTIWLPPGEPVTAGYAVEACWEPPTVTPVMNPATDFPVTANQPEPYEFQFVLNNNEVITEHCCYAEDETPDVLYAIVKQWGEFTVTHMATLGDYYDWPNGPHALPFGTIWPDYYGYSYKYYVDDFPDGDWLGVAVIYRGAVYPDGPSKQAYTLFEFTKDFE